MPAGVTKIKEGHPRTPVVMSEVVQTHHEPTAVAVHELHVRLDSFEPLFGAVKKIAERLAVVEQRQKVTYDKSGTVRSNDTQESPEHKTAIEMTERKEWEYRTDQSLKALFLRTESLRRDVDRIDMTLREILEHLRRSFPSTFRRVGA